MVLTGSGPVSSLSGEQLDRMANTLTRAFDRHPTWVRTIPDLHRRRRALFAFFRFAGSVFNRYGILFCVRHQDSTVGYLSLMRDDDPFQISIARLLRTRALGDVFRFARSLRLRELLATARFERKLRQHHSGRRGEAGSLHLYFAGIEPEYRGRSIMRHGFLQMESQLKALGYRSYRLETSDPANLPVYERFGLTRNGALTVVLARETRNVWFFERQLFS